MQNTLPIHGNHPMRGVEGLAQQIALPGEHSPLRFPSFPALERTAVMAFNQPATVNLPANTSTAFTIFRSATYPVWADISRTYFAYVDYLTDELPNSLYEAASATLPVVPNLISWGTTARNVSSAYTGVAAVGIPQQVYPLLGRDGSSEYVYIPGGCAAAFVLGLKLGTAGAATVTDFTINYEEWRSPGQSSSGALGGSIGINHRGAMSDVIFATTGRWIRPTTVVTAFIGATVPSEGYTLTLAVGSSSGVTFLPSLIGNVGQINFGTLTPVVGHYPISYPVEFANSQLPWFAARVTAAAMLGTNVSQVLNKGGTILGGRVSPAVQNAWSVTEDYVNGLHPAEKAFLPLETGVYTYAPPSTDLIFFGDYTINTGDYEKNGAVSPPMAPMFLLGIDSLYNKLFLRASAVAETLACTCTWHIEFRTSSALFQVGLSNLTLESLHQAQLTLAKAGFFFENPKHVSLLSRVAKMGRKYGPPMAKALNPTLGRVVKLIANVTKGKQKGKGKGKGKGGRTFIQPPTGPRKPPATSGQRSGISNAPKNKSGLDIFLGKNPQYDRRKK